MATTSIKALGSLAEIEENLTCIREPGDVSVRLLCSSCHKTWLDTSQEKCQLYVRSFFEKEAVSFENGLLTLQIVRFCSACLNCSLYQPHPFY